MQPIDIVIPVYNEPLEAVQATIQKLKQAFTGYSEKVSIIVVNDGSAASFRAEELRNDKDITYLQHNQNRGYGFALKSGILSGTAPWIAIIDSDSTYPPEDLPALVAEMQNNDMVIGCRTGEVSEIPMMRRFPKKMLNLLSSYFAGTPIADLNSGMRVFSRNLAYFLWNFFPQGFSFTSTITMGAILGGFRIREMPINYYKRSGQSSIHPILDTIKFFRLVLRLGLIFAPMKLFTPVALTLFGVGFYKGFLVDYRTLGYIGNLAVILMISAVQIFMMGLVAKLIVHNRHLPLPANPNADAASPQQPHATGGSSSSDNSKRTRAIGM